MAKGFGIAGLITAIVAIFIPFIGIFISGVAIVCAVIAALAGDRIFATAVPIIALINTFFLSASVWMAMGGQGEADRSAFTFVVFACAAAPFIAMVLNATGRMAFNSNK